MKITITNRSGWPDEALEVLCQWVADRYFVGEDVKRNYIFLLREASSKRHWHGSGGKFRQCLSIHRRMEPYSRSRQSWPYGNKDHRYKWSRTYLFRSRLEVLVFLMGHEACHATKKGKLRRTPTGRGRVAEMEDVCNRSGWQTVLALRGEWTKLFGEIKRRTSLQACRTRRERRHKMPRMRVEKAWGLLEKETGILAGDDQSVDSAVKEKIASLKASGYLSGLQVLIVRDLICAQFGETPSELPDAVADQQKPSELAEKEEKAEPETPPETEPTAEAASSSA